MSNITPPNPWQNWAGNLSSSYATYATPTTLAELQQVVKSAAAAGQMVRVSGQRHAQPPLVANSSSNLVLVDLSCYADLGPNGQSRIVNNGNNTVTVNTGVREDELAGFLLNNQLMLQTVTAGGFFSIGGMTSVDVHGATINAPIFAETASAYSIMGPDGVVTTIDANTPLEGNWQPLQFARVSLGALGIVTSVTLNVIPRPYANSLVGSVQAYNWANQQDFINGMGPILAPSTGVTRVETFFNPYACNGNPLGLPGLPASFLTCCWNDEAGSPPAPSTVNPETACQYAEQGQYGAPLVSGETIAEAAALAAQASGLIGLTAAATLTAIEILTIKGEVQTADTSGSDMWLTQALRTIFMSYFVPLPDLSSAGLGIIWGALQSVMNKVTGLGSAFHVAFPLEFRIVQSGNTALAGTYSDTPCHFVNLDLIGVAAMNSANNGLQFTPALLQFFADVESEWIGLGGWPHNGKMYGFYNPNGPAGNSGPPFNPGMLSYLAQKRATRVQAFKAYQQKLDPKGMFTNAYVNALIG
ncbi:MAG: D-arabinono-1,4-lactone oxidase [Candidatus Korobacteraceae bacterium]